MRSKWSVQLLYFMTGLKHERCLHDSSYVETKALLCCLYSGYVSFPCTMPSYAILKIRVYAGVIVWRNLQ
jgi:hypothetical protein